MDFHWKEPRLSFPRFEATDNDTVAIGEGWADFDPRRNSMTVTVREGTLRIGHLTWDADRPVVVEGRGPDYEILPARYSSAAGSALVASSFRTEAKTMDWRFSEMSIDLAAMAGEKKPPDFHGGMLHGDLRLKGPVRLPDPSGRLIFSDYRYGPGTIDSAMFAFEAVGNRLTVDAGWLESGPGRLSLAGSAVLPEEAWTVWNRWREGQPIAWERLILNDLDVWGNGLDLARWASWNPKLGQISGVASGRARVAGSLGAPRFKVEAQVLDLSRGAHRVDSLEVRASYEPDRLTIEELSVSRAPASSRASGALAVELSLLPPRVRLLEEPMNISLDLPRADLSLVPLFAPAVERAEGWLAGQISLQGTPRRYLLYGDVAIKDGALQLKGSEEVVEGIEAQVRFDGETVELLSLRGRQGEEGRVAGRGTYELGEAPQRAYKLELDLTKFVIRHGAEYAAEFDGHFEVVPINLPDGAVRPLTVGDIELSRAEILREFDQPQAVVDPGQVVYYSLAIDAPRGIFIVNDDVDMELSGRLTARRTPERSELIGEMEILRGYYTLLLRRFRIVEGRLTFSRLDVIDPTIDITAETNDAAYRITVRITGDASHPVIKFEATPGKQGLPELSEEEILRRLAPGSELADQFLNAPTAPGIENLGVDVLTRSVQLLLTEIQRDVARQIGVDEIHLDTRGLEDEGSYGTLRVSKWVTPEVSVSYAQGLAGSLEQDLSVEYRLGRLLFLRGELIRRRNFEEEYNVDLRFWHEY
jgi:autotransporter translocation and assembly factor TamB